MPKKLPTLDDVNKNVGEDKLTPRQFKFSVEYVTNGRNGMKAIRDAGFNHSTPGSQSSAAHRLLKKPKIKYAVKAIQTALK